MISMKLPDCLTKIVEEYAHGPHPCLEAIKAAVENHRNRILYETKAHIPEWRRPYIGFLPECLIIWRIIGDTIQIKGSIVHFRRGSVCIRIPDDKVYSALKSYVNRDKMEYHLIPLLTFYALYRPDFLYPGGADVVARIHK